MNEKVEVAKVKECEWCGSMFSAPDLSATECSNPECVEDRADMKEAEAIRDERDRARQREVAEARADLAEMAAPKGDELPTLRRKHGADLFTPAIRMLELARELGREGHEDLSAAQAGLAHFVLTSALVELGVPTTREEMLEVLGACEALPEEPPAGVPSGS